MLGKLINRSSAAKLLIFSATLLSSSFLVKLALASDSDFNLFLSSLPRPWIPLRLWLSPIRVYLILNFIILAITATSAFQSHHNDAPAPAASTTSDHAKITDSAKDRDEEPAEETGEKVGEKEIEGTMEATWKSIMEAQGKSRSEIWNLPAAGRGVEQKWMSEEELKRKAEAFINKINQDMRLERQQSELRHTIKKKMLHQGKAT